MKRTSLSLLLLLSAVLLVSCGEEPGKPVTILVPVGPGALRAPQINLDDLEYGSISGTLAEGQGGVLYDYMPEWPVKCLFGLVVPPTSMPPGESITFTMSVPTQEMYEDPQYAAELEGWLVIRLAPHGQQFLGPITVIGTWMPWEGAPPSPLYYQNGSEWGVATVTQVGARWRVTFDVDHFSDWETGPELPD